VFILLRAAKALVEWIYSTW